MMLVTASSRILPAFFLQGRKLPPFLEAFLHYVPFAVLGSLIFPDVLTGTATVASSAAGALAAAVLAWFGRGILVVITGGILAAFFVSQMGF